MGSGFLALKDVDFEHAITELALEAGDADTNCCVAGFNLSVIVNLHFSALLGCKIGYSRLPSEWLFAMPHRIWLEEKVRQLCSLML